MGTPGRAAISWIRVLHDRSVISKIPKNTETIIGIMTATPQHCIWYQHSTSEEGMLKHDSSSTYNMMLANVVCIKTTKEKEPGADMNVFMFAGFDPSLAFNSNAQAVFDSFLGVKMKIVPANITGKNLTMVKTNYAKSEIGTIGNDALEQAALDADE
ncbi:hypothetical protein GUITHDRAFT_136415 [Guillardia theta CCMP2712]|uniref:Uncharacterized protein n=1 Tax=Guillardia theta (strain CCMP2712) TaxID=905079 RepID=L1JKR7_GUITC|nr:hypothetical protein GUITHDRAFT_136415 [Guillardia theta CCMP2712]EKX48734.1 hypothetical protein GUITHDRAFT_136415 [Guillardia theta CCMP2712]|eukprot:XP_005835714.1 hypothetical protein GUITHDRAFT_136415 [Guillardia theta CCMP2712]